MRRPRVGCEPLGANTTVRTTPCRTDHPAVLAWRLGPALGQPSKVEPLKETPERSVYKLCGVGAPGGEIIAKRSPSGTLDVEKLVYDEILPELGLPSLRCYGLLPSSGSGDDWLFVEAARGAAFSPVSREHRALAGHWLGRLHQLLPSAAAAAKLPTRPPIPYYEYIRIARAEFARYRSTDATDAGAVSTLDRIEAQFDLVDDHQEEIGALRAGLPRVPVHGDFVARNARVDVVGDRRVMLAFDWQDAAWGTPEMDLAQAPLPSRGFAGNPDIDTYWLAVRARWPCYDLDALHQLANLATLFRCLVAISWDAPGLGRWGARVGTRLRYYLDALDSVIQRAGWSG